MGQLALRSAGYELRFVTHNDGIYLRSKQYFSIDAHDLTKSSGIVRKSYGIIGYILLYTMFMLRIEGMQFMLCKYVF